jgi:hypothetical protein
MVGLVLKQFESQSEGVHLCNLHVEGDGFDQGEHRRRHRSNRTDSAAP